MRDWMNRLVDEVSEWPGVTSHDHRFGGVEFRLGAREIGHVHSFGIVDIPFTRKIRDALISAGRGEQHHWLPDSGWTTIRISEGAENNAAQLLRLSYLRIQLKSGDPAADQALAELQSLELARDLLAAVAPAEAAVTP
jgi:Family of unknown function (DUF5519)